VYAGRRVIGSNNRVERSPQRIWGFLVHRHNDNDFGGRLLAECVLYPLLTPKRHNDDPINAKEPRNGEYAGETVKGKLLKKIDQLRRKVLLDSTW